MHLYLVRHGEAVSEREDPVRPLSQRGEQEVHRAALFICENFGASLGSILHSPKTRAVHTARIMGKYLPPVRGTEQTDGLLPMDDPGIWARRMGNMELDIMLVGHLPHLSRLASTLLCWNSEISIVEFHTGTAACLEGHDGSWRLKWLVGANVLK